MMATLHFPTLHLMHCVLHPSIQYAESKARLLGTVGKDVVIGVSPDTQGLVSPLRVLRKPDQVKSQHTDQDWCSISASRPCEVPVDRSGLMQPLSLQHPSKACLQFRFQPLVLHQSKLN